MSTGQTIHKARLIEMSADFANEKPGGRRITVQFNPDSLKVNFANQIQTPTSTGDQSGTSNKLYVGSGNTKLQLQLWFDVNQPQPGEQRFDDVRKLTEQVAWFITPQPDGNKFVPPAVRFEWGTFLFDGVMDSLDETLEFFSSDGRPLRASVSLGMSRQEISAFKFGTAGARGVGPAGNAPPGTRPLAEAEAGQPLQRMTDRAGVGDWQAVARRNGIENPRRLDAGRLLDLTVEGPRWRS